MKEIFISFLWLLPALASGQEWIRVFSNNSRDVEMTVAECPDNGYVLSGYLTNNQSIANGWIVKTDINGQTLWDKKIINPDHYTYCLNTSPCGDNGYITAGSTTLFDDYCDPFVLKLNACGEKEWCHVYQDPGTPNYAIKTLPLSGGGYICLIRYYQDIFHKRIWLFRLDNSGNTLWSNYYRQDTNYINEDAFDLRITSDSTFLLTGTNDTEVNPGSGLYWTTPFWIKVDLEGNEIWESTWHEPGFLTGDMRQSAESKRRYYIGAGNTGTNAPCSMSLYKIKYDGSPFQRIELLSNYFGGWLSQVDFLQDSTLVLGARYMTNVDSSLSLVMVTDTNGNILHRRTLNVYEGFNPRGVTVTYDDKIMVSLVVVKYTPAPAHFETNLFKFNKDLEYDTNYSALFAYDTICPHPIASDTLSLNCWPTDVEEIFFSETTALAIYPNPAAHDASVTIPDYISQVVKKNGMTIIKKRLRGQEPVTVTFWSDHGKCVKEFSANPAGQVVSFDVLDLPDGIYLIHVYNAASVLGTGKLIIRH